MTNKQEKSVLIDGKKMAEARKRRFMSQQDLANASGLRKGRLSAIEQSSEPMSVFINSIHKLSVAFGVAPHELIEELRPTRHSGRIKTAPDIAKSIPIHGRKLAEERKKALLTQSKLAVAVRLDRSRIAAIEQSPTPVSVFINRIPLFARALNLTPEEAVRKLSSDSLQSPNETQQDTQATAASQFGLTEAEAEAILKRHLDEVSRAKEDRLGSGREHRRVS